MTSVESAIHDFVREHREAETRFLAEIVKVPSDNPPGDCDRSAEAVAKLLEGLGLHGRAAQGPGRAGQGQRHDLGDQSDRRGAGSGRAVRPSRSTPMATWCRRARAGRSDPYGAEIVDGWMVGRGVAVSKSDIATYAFAMLALEKSGAKLNGTVELHVTYDEEAGGEIGPRWILEQGLSKPDLAIGAGFSYAVVNAHNGCLHLEVEVLGRSAHAARPFTGVDALEAANAILAALYGWRGGLAARASAVPGIGSPQMTVGLISGGINTNVVPDRVTFRLDRRMVPEENPAEVEAELRAVIARAAALHPDARVDGQPHPARRAADAHARPARSSPRFSAATRAASWASRSPPRACRSIPTPATTRRRACRSCSTAPGRIRSRKPTPTAPTSACRWRTCTRRRR